MRELGGPDGVAATLQDMGLTDVKVGAYERDLQARTAGLVWQPDYGIGWIYTAAAAGLGLWFLVEAHRLLRRIRRDVEMKPMQLFHVSISYLALLSVAIVVDAIV